MQLVLKKGRRRASKITGISRHFRALLCLIAVALLSTASAADDVNRQIDALLARSTSELAPADQPTVIQQLEALEESAPARKLEIEAYLIPLRRATGASAEPAKTGADPTAAVSAKPLLLIKPSGAKAQVVRANSAAVQGAVVMIETADGRHSIYQKEFLVAQLPWFTEKELAGGTIDLGRLAARYEAHESLYPECKAALEAEAAKIRALIRVAREQAQKQEQLRLDRLAAVLTSVYEPAKNYAREELARILLEAESVRKEFPTRESEIAQAVAPFREHFENLLAGKVLVDGMWLTKEYFERMAKAHELENKRIEFNQNLSIPLDALVLSEDRIFHALQIPAAIAIVVVVAGLIQLLLRKRFLLAALLILVPTGAAVFHLYLMLSGDTSIEAFHNPGVSDPEKITRLLFLSSLNDSAAFQPTDRAVTVTEQDLNAFLRSHLKFTGDPGGESASLYATDLAVQMTPGGLILHECVRHKRRFYRIRYDLKIAMAGDSPAVTDCSVMFGNAAIPRPMKTWLWSGVEEQLERALRDHPLLTGYSIARMAEGEMHLTVKTAPAVSPAMASATATKKPQPSASEAPAVEPKPAPANGTTKPAERPVTKAPEDSDSTDQ